MHGSTDPKVRSAYPTLARPTSATHSAGAALSSRVYWSSIARLTKSTMRHNGTRHEVDGVTLPSLLLEALWFQGGLLSSRRLSAAGAFNL